METGQLLEDDNSQGRITVVGNQSQLKPIESYENLSQEDKALLEEFWHLVANIARRLLTKDNGERDNCDIVEGKENSNQ